MRQLIFTKHYLHSCFLVYKTVSGVSVMDCRDSFLTGEKAIPDSAFTASSVYATYSPERGRLDTQKSGSKHGAWAGASATDVTQWIQVLQTDKLLTRVVWYP